jgi:hypothetical protein
MNESPSAHRIGSGPIVRVSHVRERGNQDAEDDRPRLAVLRGQCKRKQLRLVADLGEGDYADGNEKCRQIRSPKWSERSCLA